MVYRGICLRKHSTETGHASSLGVQPLVVEQSVLDILDDSADVGNLIDQGRDLIRRAANLEDDFQACINESADGENACSNGERIHNVGYEVELLPPLCDVLGPFQETKGSCTWNLVQGSFLLNGRPVLNVRLILSSSYQLVQQGDQ